MKLQAVERPVFDLWSYARMAYHPELVRKFAKANEMKFGDDYGFNLVLPDVVIVAFQGTGTLIKGDTGGKFRDWLSNLSAWAHMDELEKNDMRIHFGFYEGWKLFKQTIKALAASDSTKGKPWYITGHSRGGALAALCARHLAKNEGIACSCVTYCAPAQGGRQLRNEMNMLPIDLTNVVHGADIVPRMPPRVMGYRHGGKVVEWREKWWHYILPSYKIRDHLPKNLDKWLKKHGH